jgi:uncharacterized membrane protein
MSAAERVAMPRERLRTLFLTGLAVIVPLVVSGWVVLSLADFVLSLLGPVRTELRKAGVESDTTVALLQVASLLVVALVILLLGAFVQVRFGRELVDRVDAMLAGLPGLGTVYQTARQMSDLLLNPNEEEGGNQFREVKLVEFPGSDTYTLGFQTSDSPPAGVVDSAREITGDPDEEYYTLFLPMAPNPFMGGHLTHVPADRVYEVDIEVESAIQYILTTGVVDDPETV